MESVSTVSTQVESELNSLSTVYIYKSEQLHMEAERSSINLLFAYLRSKRKTWWDPHEINYVSSITKHLFYVVCLKRSNHRNKHLKRKYKINFLFVFVFSKYFFKKLSFLFIFLF